MTGGGGWLEVRVAAPAGTLAELAALALFESGALGIEERDPEPSGRVVLVAHIPAERLPLDAGPIAALGASVIGTTRVRERDWEASYRASLAPILLGEKLVVLPHGSAVVSGGRKPIHLEPGSAFGTGLHPTTAMAASALEHAVEARRAGGTALSPVSVLDVGTGSGILAIAAYLLGGRPVLAIDDDPDAVAEAWANARRNGCREAFEASDRPLETIEAHFSVVVGNLDAPTLGRVGELLAARVEPTGELIVSGLRVGETWPAPDGLIRIASETRDGWRCERWRAPLAPH